MILTKEQLKGIKVCPDCGNSNCYHVENLIETLEAVWKQHDETYNLLLKAISISEEQGVKLTKYHCEAEKIPSICNDYLADRCKDTTHDDCPKICPKYKEV